MHRSGSVRVDGRMVMRNAQIIEGLDIDIDIEERVVSQERFIPSLLYPADKEKCII
jgi:hypothetical protein